VAKQVDKKAMACNKPKRTPSHPKKSHIVKACEGGKEKIIRFGEQGASTAGKPKKGESARMKAKRKSFKARHGKNIAKKDKMGAMYWADKVKWIILAAVLSGIGAMYETDRRFQNTEVARWVQSDVRMWG
jgi:hypothetical protein